MLKSLLTCVNDYFGAGNFADGNGCPAWPFPAPLLGKLEHVKSVAAKYTNGARPKTTPVTFQPSELPGIQASSNQKELLLGVPLLIS